MYTSVSARRRLNFFLENREFILYSVYTYLTSPVEDGPVAVNQRDV